MAVHKDLKSILDQEKTKRIVHLLDNRFAGSKITLEELKEYPHRRGLTKKGI